MTNDDAVIQFHHREKNGDVNHHEDANIGTDSFQTFVQSNLNDGKAGPCWLSTCTAIIHPDEIKELVRLDVFPEALFKRYKEAFNRLQKGGGGDILREAKTAECVVWTDVTRTTRRTRKLRRNTNASTTRFLRLKQQKTRR
jgi:hypothetical protein